MKFARECVCDVVGEIDDILQKHYLELAKNQDKVKLNVDWDRYAQAERTGSLLLFTARNEKLAGYSVFFSCLHPHYKDMQLVSNDVLYLDKEYRTGRTGVQLIRYCEQQVSKLFSHVSLAWHAKENTTLAQILPRMGYAVQDIILSKLL